MRIESPAKEIVRYVNVQRLNEAGIIATRGDEKSASEIIASMSDEERRRAAGLCFIREHAALWFFSNRSTFFEQEHDVC
jgi:hypothetical protein